LCQRLPLVHEEERVVPDHGALDRILRVAVLGEAVLDLDRAVVRLRDTFTGADRQLVREQFVAELVLAARSADQIGGDATGGRLAVTGRSYKDRESGQRGPWADDPGNP